MASIEETDGSGYVAPSNRWVRRIVVTLAAVCLIFIGFALFFPPQSKEERAREFLTLPTGASVLSVEKGEGEGDGAVEFVLPQSAPPEQWISRTWTYNGFPGPTSKKKYEWFWTQGGARQTLKYELPTRVYRYEVALPK